MGGRENGGGGLAKGWRQLLHPGPSINGGKPSDLDWPQAAERPLRHPPHSVTMFAFGEVIHPGTAAGIYDLRRLQLDKTAPGSG